jgi:hypothetical protein
MKSKMIRMLCLLACIAVAVPLLAARPKAADAITGTWSGDWGPSPNDRNQVNVDLKFDGKSMVTGVVHSTNFQRPDVKLEKSTFNPSTGVIHMEATVPAERGGGTVHFIIDGKVMGGSMTGSWNHGDSKGDFKLTKK